MVADFIGMKKHTRVALLIAAAATLPAPGVAQTAARATFDVASVKPVDQDWLQIAPERSGGRITWATDLFYLISYAWHIPRWRISGPIPADAPMVRIEATTAPDTTEDQVRIMFQSLLADRFKMVSHTISREADGYVLSVAKGGPKIKEVKPDDPPPPLPEWFRGTSAATLEGKVVSTLPLRGIGAITGRRVSMAQLCEALERRLETFVLDETSLKGNYYFALRYALDDRPPDVEPDAPSLFGVIQQDLGLKIEKRRGPLNILVVDSIAKVPVEN